MPGPLMVSIEGTTLDAATRSRLAHPNIGGVILFERNYASPRQLADLTREIKEFKDPQLLIAVDQEGGRVQRFQKGFRRVSEECEQAVQSDRHPHMDTHVYKYIQVARMPRLIQ